MEKTQVIYTLKAEAEKIMNVQLDLSLSQGNNGVAITDLKIKNTNSPAVHINEAVDEILSGALSIKDAAQSIKNTFREAILTESKIDFAGYLDKQFILQNVILVLVNSDKNIATKECEPHRNYLNLTAFYRVIVGKKDDCVTSFRVTNPMVELLKITEHELFDAAMANTKKAGYFTSDFDGISMFVITTKEAMYGASALLHPEVMQELADNVGSDLYILPSSIHEIIALPCSIYSDTDSLRAMVREINEDSSKVAPDEVLGNDIYLYRRNEKMLTLA